jgi:hypothetical protein
MIDRAMKAVGIPGAGFDAGFAQLNVSEGIREKRRYVRSRLPSLAGRSTTKRSQSEGACPHVSSTRLRNQRWA